MKVWVVCVLSTIFVCCYGHTVHFGRTCPDLQPFPNLSIDKIVGVWFVAYQFDTSNTCMIWNLTKSVDNSEQLKLIESRQLYLIDAIGIDHKHSITATIDIPNPEVPSKMRIRWPTSITGKADFIVFDTDYENYLAIFQCDRAAILHRRDVTILSRTPNVDDMFVKRVRRLLDTANVGHGSLEEISHNLCKKDTRNNWHIDGELFGLIPSDKGEIKQLGKDVKDYDLSQIEIISDGISAMSENFRGSQKTKDGVEI